MTRPNHDTFFERLLQLRSGYGTSADDRLPVLALDDAIAYAEAVMTAIGLDADRAPTGPTSAGPAYEVDLGD